MLGLDRILPGLESAQDSERLAAARALDEHLRALAGKAEEAAVDGTEGSWPQVAERCLPALVRALGDPHKGVQVHGANCLQTLLPHVPEVTPRLADAMSSPDRWQAWAAALAAARAGLWLVPMQDALGGALGAEDRDVRWAAAGLTVKLGRTHPEAVALVKGALLNGLPLARRMAAYALAAIGCYSSVESELVQALKDPDRNVRRAAVLALGKLPAVSRESVAAVAALQSDPDVFVGRAARAVSARLES